MTRLLVDTTFLIDAEHGGIELDEVIADDDDVAIAAITFAELRVGVLLADGRRRQGRSEFVDAVRRGLQVVDYDSDVADVHGDLLAFVGARGLLGALMIWSSRRPHERQAVMWSPPIARPSRGCPAWKSTYAVDVGPRLVSIAVNGRLAVVGGCLNEGTTTDRHF